MQVQSRCCCRVAPRERGGLVALLAAAAHKDVDWLFLLVPEHYKRSAQRVHVARQLRQLAAAPGVALDLKGVSVMGY